MLSFALYVVGQRSDLTDVLSVLSVLSKQGKQSNFQKGLHGLNEIAVFVRPIHQWLHVAEMGGGARDSVSFEPTTHSSGGEIIML